MATPAYDTVLHDYLAAINDVRRPAAGIVERGGGAVSPAASEAALDRLVQNSEALRTTLTSAADADPDLRDVAGLKLLAAAAYDLGLVEGLLTADEPGAGVVERSASAIFTSPDLREILNAPLDAKAMEGLAPVERAAFPTDPAQARVTLHDMVEPYAKAITDASADSANRAVTGAVTFHMVGLPASLSVATQELLAHVPEGVTTFVRYAARLAQEAVRKLWDALGKSEQDNVMEQTKSWFDELLDKKAIAAFLLDRLYQSVSLQTEVKATIDGSQVTVVRPFKNSANGLDALSARHARIMTTLNWVMRGIGLIKTPLLAVPPWGPMVAYGVYGGVLGYAIYSGGDFLGARWFDNKWLSHVVGMRPLIQRELGT